MRHPLQQAPATDLPATDPGAIYRYRESLTAVDALTVAIVHLDLFSALADHPADLPSICRMFSIHPRPTDTLCTLLVANGLLLKRSNCPGKQQLTTSITG
jgi:hypothetical protein